MSKPLFTAEQIVTKTINSLEYQITEKERELVSIEGEIAAMQTTLANIRQWKNATATL